MREDVDDVLALRAQDFRGLSRVMTWSFAIHLALVAALVVVPRNWLTRQPEPRQMMTISLEGMTPIGARPVEQAIPEPRRPEPVRPATSKPDVMTVPAKTPPKPTPTPPKVETQPSPVTRPPSTGRQVQSGTSAVETGAQGQGTGLSLSAGASSQLDALQFCCPEYVEQMKAVIQRVWQKSQPERGKTTMQFTIMADGSLTDIKVEQSSGSGLLDRQSQYALIQVQQQKLMPPLPKAYGEPKLVVHLTFPYGIQ